MITLLYTIKKPFLPLKRDFFSFFLLLRFLCEKKVVYLHVEERPSSSFYAMSEKTYDKTERKIQRLFSRACAEYRLLEDGDRVLVAVSGGKDSLELLRLMSRQGKIHKPRITVEAAHVIMDNIPYETDRSFLQWFCDDLDITVRLLHTSFDDTASAEGGVTRHRRKTKCFLCSWYRRKALFEYARDHGFTKVAFGHHQDDFLVTMLMNMTFEGSLHSISPMMPMRHYPFKVIRPLCLVPESLIATVAKTLCFERQKTLCPFEKASRREDMTQVFRTLEGMNPEARYSMWRALEKVSTTSDEEEDV